MLTVKDESVISTPASGSPSSVTWFYLSFEFLIGLAISGFFLFLSLVKSYLPKPPRDLAGNVVLVTGATTNLGGLLAEEFARGGCSVICVDEDAEAVERVAARLRGQYPGVARVGPNHRKQADEGRAAARAAGLAYSCNLWDRHDIMALAKRVMDEVGHIDVLVTCACNPGQALFSTVNRTLMSHYWTVLGFLPSMLHRESAHVIGITPVVSTEDAYRGSKAAVAGLMDSMGQHFSGRNNTLTFMTVAPKADPSLLGQSEQEIAKEVVEAVRKGLPCINMSLTSKFIYNVSCRLYIYITTLTSWIDT